MKDLVTDTKYGKEMCTEKSKVLRTGKVELKYLDKTKVQTHYPTAPHIRYSWTLMAGPLK